MTTYDLERKTAVEAARLAGRLCMAIREEMLKDRSFMEKAGREPVTIADYGAQAIVLHHVSEQFPDDGTLAEERADDFLRLTDDDAKASVVRHVSRVLGMDLTLEDITRWLDFGRGREASRVWVVDPIDGTKGFLRGDQFAVAVSLVVDGVPVVGALGCPMMPYGSNGATNPRGTIVSAVKGQGATAEPADGGPVRPAHVSEWSDALEARVVESVEVGHTSHGFSAQVLDTAGIGGQPVRIDSQAKYMAVADGRAEIYIRRSKGGYNERVWDHAAGAVIVEEAGGRVTDLYGQPLDFSIGSHLEKNRGILATNGPLHDVLLEAIEKVRVENPEG